ncbi:hypothetical protein PQX77_017030 [Marasmius sp. AFHP31]|nr:hypothetical protein PQX77_017030 [Marasmius sp. AFHP31]
MALLVSFSTHVLCERSGKEIPLSDEKLDESALAAKYFSKVDSAKLIRKSWCLSASRMQDTGRELEMLRARLSPTEGQLRLAYDSLSTEKLLAVRDAKLQDLRQQWGAQAGSESLDFALKLAGFRGLDAGENREFDTTARVASLKDRTGTVSVTIPLPVAAARHPSHLRKLRKPVFESISRQISSKNDTGPTSQQTPTQVNPPLADEMRGQVRMSSTLKEALGRTQRSREVLEAEWCTPSVGHGSGERRACLNLWHNESPRAFDVEARPTTFREFEVLLNKSTAGDTVPDPSRGINTSRSPNTLCQPAVPNKREADLSDEDDVLMATVSGAFASLLASSMSFDCDGSYMEDI